jgi:hypothetical protein
MGVWAWHRRSLDEFSDAGPQQSNAVPPECGACCGCATAIRGPSRSRRGGVGGVPPGCGAGDPPGGGHTCDAAGGACERAPGHSRTSTGRRAVDGRRRRRQGGVGEGKRASDSESAPLLLPARNSTVQRIAPRPIVHAGGPALSSQDRLSWPPACIGQLRWRTSRTPTHVPMHDSHTAA